MNLFFIICCVIMLFSFIVINVSWEISEHYPGRSHGSNPELCSIYPTNGEKTFWNYTLPNVIATVRPRSTWTKQRLSDYKKDLAEGNPELCDLYPPDGKETTWNRF